jgi:hypothetical protein
MPYTPNRMPQLFLRFSISEIRISSSQNVLFGVYRTVDLGQQYDTVPHIGGIFSFNSTIHSRVYQFGVIRYPTLPSRSSYWTFTLVHYIRRDAPPYFTKSAYPGLFHLVGFPCAWARTYYYFLVHQLCGVQTRALTSSNSHYLWGGQASSALTTAPLHFQENPRRLHHRDRVGRLYKASPEQPTSRTTQARQVLPLIFKLRARPPRSD